MKKKVGLAKALDVIPRDELQAWETRKLLSRLKRLRWCYESEADASGYNSSELAPVREKILFKSDPKWKLAYADVKSILGNRENVSN